MRLKSVYPCCKGRCWFGRVAGIPRQKYDKVCPTCGQAWTVTVDQITAREGLRIDAATWEIVGGLYG